MARGGQIRITINLNNYIVQYSGDYKIAVTSELVQKSILK